MTGPIPGPNDPASAYPAASGGGAAGLPCWFQAVTQPTGEAAMVPEWGGYSDGVAAFTDAQVGADPTTVEVLTTGTYLLGAQCAVFNDELMDPATARLTVALNDDAVGPLFDLFATAWIEPVQSAVLNVGCPVVLAAGDLLQLTIATPGTPNTHLGACLLTLIRIG